MGYCMVFHKFWVMCMSDDGLDVGWI